MSPFNWFNTTYPLAALHARKTIAQTYTYRVRYGRQERMLYYTPSNPRTQAQQHWRGVFRQAVTAWKDLTPEQIIRYNALARRTRGWTGFNLFVSDYLTAY